MFFLEGFLPRCRSLRSLAVWLAWDLDFAGRSQVVGFVTVIRIISLSVMQYTQPRRWSSMCCNASTFDGEEQKRGRAPTVVDVPPNPRWKASQLAGQQLPAGLGDLGPQKTIVASTCRGRSALHTHRHSGQ